MDCPTCAATATREQPQRTALGYRTFRCTVCRCRFNERSGTPFNFLEYPTDIVLLVVHWRLQYKLSLRDLAQMFLERGFVFTHEAVRAWEATPRCGASAPSLGRPASAVPTTNCAISSGFGSGKGRRCR